MHWTINQPLYLSRLLVPQFVPVYPATHVQLYPFIPSTQVPLFAHGLLAHSFISTIKHQVTNKITIDQTVEKNREFAPSVEKNTGIVTLIYSRLANKQGMLDN